MRAYTQGTDTLHTAYSFAFLGARPDAAAVAATLAPWDDGEGWPAWAFSNHDVPRVASRWGGGSGAGFSFGGAGTGTAPGAGPLTWMALLLALRGTVFLYQGEELGLPQSEVPFERLQDPYGIANWPIAPGRDGCRTPFPWQAHAPQAGFSPHEPWLPCDPVHAARAVDVQEADPRSLLQRTRELIRLRREQPALRHGSSRVRHAEGEVLALQRGDVLALFNLGTAPAQLPLAAIGGRPGARLWAAAEAVFDGDTARLPPGAAAFYRLPDQTNRPR
jgi:alpha-glucosidase